MMATRLAPIEAGLIQSLLIKAQRQQLDELGRELGTKVVYLKAAWADPVLYGGRGERVGSDIDILVHPARFEAFAEALIAQGFRRYRHGSKSHEDYFGYKEWTLLGPPGVMSVDLHRALTEPIWFELDTEGLLERAMEYPSVDGPVLSLSVEDQILYGAAHYANHMYILDGRHLGDCRKLVEMFPVDWDVVYRRAREAKMRLPVELLVEALLRGGASVPAGASSPLFRLRKRIASRYIETSPDLRRRGERSRLVDYLVLRPVLSDRLTALPQMAATFGVPWLRDRAMGLLRSREPKSS